jgi:hypothetical protein
MPQATQQQHQPTAHQFGKGLDDWVEIFRAGNHVDSKGKPCSFTTADLDQIVVNNSKLGPAPLVLGHPQHDDPSFGWTHELKRDGESLFMKAGEVHPDFAASVKSGAYRNRSVHVFPDQAHGWRLRHVGWLGAAPPAIDLKPVQFAAAEDEGHEFASADVSAWDVSSALDDIAALMRGWRERLIATDGVDAANEALPDWRISSISATAARIREAGNSTTNSLFTHAPSTTTMSLTQADLDRTAAETEARIRAELGSQFTASNAELAQLKAERQRERIATQIAGWKAAGQLLPAEEPGLAEFMAALEGGEPGVSFEFTAADGKATAKKTAPEFFAEFVAARGALVKLTGAGGQAGGDSDPKPKLDTGDYQAIVKAANEFQAAESKAGREIGIDAAVAHVTRNV